MKFKYKVTDNEGKVSDMEAMSFKKLRRKLDHKSHDCSLGIHYDFQ